MVVVLKSWKSIAERIGEEALDITENLFVNLCRFATQDASAQARLSSAAFAAFWDVPAQQRHTVEVLTRWLPAHLQAPAAHVPIDAEWFAYEVSKQESSRDVFDRVAADLDEEALPRGWDGQVG